MREQIIFYYDGDSFARRIDIADLELALQGIREFILENSLDRNFEITVEPFTGGSFPIKIKWDNPIVSATVGGVLSGLIILGVQSLQHVENKPYEVINNGNGTINIININGEVKSDLPKEILEIIENPKSKVAGKKFLSPLKIIDDSLKIASSEEEINQCVNPLTIDSSYIFDLPEDIIDNDREIRGKIYAINLRAKSFKINIPSQEREFTVHITNGASFKIRDILRYVGTNDIKLIGIAKINYEEKITKFNATSFELIQMSIPIEEETE
jgi:hypothetical protein